MNVVPEGSNPRAHRGIVAVVLALSIAMGIGLTQLEELTGGAATPWLDVGICATPLLSALFVVYGLIERPRLHFMFFMLLQAGMTLAPLFARPTSPAWFVTTGLLWSTAVAACAMGHRRAGAAFVLGIGCLLTGLQLSRVPPARVVTPPSVV